MKKTVILIDGQNLFYSLRNISVIERNVKWDEFFKSLINPTDELIRTYWFRPQRILDTHLTTHNIQSTVVYKQFSAYMSAYKANPSSIPAHIMTQITTEVNRIENWVRTEKNRFSQIEYAYDQLALAFEDIEFVKTGIVKIDPYNEIYVGEKGVDISVAVKMIALSVDKSCDNIVLVSGDYDYVEAIKYVKDKMTKVHIVKFHKGTPPKNKSVSRDLAVLADKVIDIYESDFKTKFLKP